MNASKQPIPAVDTPQSTPDPKDSHENPSTLYRVKRVVVGDDGTILAELSERPPTHPYRPDPNPHLKTAFRRIALNWSPENSDDAREMLEECISRAEAMANVMDEYCASGYADSACVRQTAEVLADLLWLGYSMIEWWESHDDLIKAGWQPPQKAEEGRP